MASKDKTYYFTYILLLFSLYAGTVFYDLLSEMGFTYTDELIILCLFISMIAKKKIGREMVAFFVISVTFLVYSLFYGQNVKKAVIIDFFIQIKPFLGFYCVYYMNLTLSPHYKKRLNLHVVLVALVLLIGAIINYELFVERLPVHPSRFATIYVILGFLYFYSSGRRKANIIITFLIWSISILSLRSKAYGFATISAILILFTSPSFYKFRFSTILGVIFIISITVFFTWGKFSFYFVEGAVGRDLDNMMARPALYVGALQILRDFPLMGSGLGSYASYASSVYYSPVYYLYSLNAIHGLGSEPENGNFICDAFYPSFAQIGLVGILLFVWFFARRVKQIRLLYNETGDFRVFQMCLLIIIFFMIESFSDTTFVQNRGVVLMMIFSIFECEEKTKCATSICRVNRHE